MRAVLISLKVAPSTAMIPVAATAEWAQQRQGETRRLGPLGL
jgi:hypothetical protein